MSSRDTGRCRFFIADFLKVAPESIKIQITSYEKSKLSKIQLVTKYINK